MTKKLKVEYYHWNKKFISLIKGVKELEIFNGGGSQLMDLAKEITDKF
jgi:hypothetical protein